MCPIGPACAGVISPGRAMMGIVSPHIYERGPVGIVRRRAPRPVCVWAAAGRCGPTASGGWGWWTSPRPGGLFGWCSRRRWRCTRRGCSAGAVTEQDPAVAPVRERLTARAGRWATRRAGRGRPVKDVPPCHRINRLGRTTWRWRAQISNWHTARVTNAPTEAANNLAKRVKRAAFGLTNFANHRIRALPYAGKPNRTLLDTLTPP